MTKDADETEALPEAPNTRPGPTDEGGHGGMATREQEARQRARAEQADGEL